MLRDLFLKKGGEVLGLDRLLLGERQPLGLELGGAARGMVARLF